MMDTTVTPAERAALTKPLYHPYVGAWLATLPPDTLLVEARYLANELAVLKGYGHTPQAGCKFAHLTLGLADVLVEYEYSPGRPGRSYMPNGDPGYPDEPAELAIIQALINGYWCDPADCLADCVIERWMSDILESIAADHDAAASERANRERDYE